MTLPGLTLRLPYAALALLLAACGDDGGGTASNASNGTSSSEPTNVTSSTSTTQSSESNSATDPTTTAGSMSMSASETGSTGPGTSVSSSSSSATAETTNSTGPDETTTMVSTSSSTGVDPDTSSSVGPSSSSVGPGESTTNDETTGPPPVMCPCPDLEVPLDDGIFVLSSNAQLWKFFPESLTFDMLGAFNCNNMQNTFSMAVDRLGFAWVMFNPPAGEIWKIDVTAPMNCIDPGYNPGMMGVNLFGMAFVSNSAFDQCDSLYGNTFDGFGGFSEGPNFGDFINVDPDTLALSILGPTNYNGAEVTGTGDGRVFLFAGVNPSKLIEVDKTNGTPINILPLPGLELTNAFAFAFFGGDFYMFTEANNPTFSKVTHLDYDDSDNNGMQDLKTVVNQAPLRIVGAGVSTCAPFMPQ